MRSGNCCRRNKRHRHRSCDDCKSITRNECCLVVMATQTFMPEMQAIPPGNVQTPPAQQPNSGVSSTVNQSGQQQQQVSQQAQSQQRTQQQTSTSSSANGSQSQQQSQQQTQSTGTSAQVNVAVGQQTSAQPQQQSTIVQTAQPSQQFIAVTVSEDENTGQDTVTLQNATQAVHSTYVQYVEGNTDPNIYAATNGQMTAYPVYCVSDTNTMYTPATAYYNAGNSTAVTYSQDSGVAYLVQGTSVDGDSHHLTHATRVSPATVQWLLDNYETAEGVSLPRSTLYNHYLRHCSEHKLDPVNAASFGKLIRSVFLGLRTRRLGTRGNSKYHYYGIRVKPNSPLNQITDDVGTMALRQQPMNQGKRFKPPTSQKTDSQDCGQTTGTHSQTSSSSSDSTSPQQQQHQQFLGDTTTAIPTLGAIEFSSMPEGISIEDVHCFRLLYKEHCEAFLEAVINMQFSMVEILWQQFWRIQISEQDHTDLDIEKRLSKPKLYILCKSEPIQHFVRKCDYQFYQNLVEVLIPDVLRPIPSSLTQAIRNFAKSLEGWLTAAMTDSPEEMVKIKISAVSAFAQTLRRYTSLNHLAQAARAVLQNSSQINQMLADLNRVDFHNVQEQASWVCQCDDGMVQKLEQDFKMTLQQQNSLEQWAAWLEGVVSQVLKSHEGKPDFAKAARQFLLKWSFYSSMVIRDLTLRSAASFGSFHLIRLLYDEYMFYLIEHRVALATGETPIAVMGEFIGLGHKNMRDLSKGVSGSNIIAANGNHTNHTSSSGINTHTTTSSSSPGQKIVMLNAASSSSPNLGSSSTTASHGHITKRLKTN